MKKILNYIIIFIVSLFILFSALVASSKIPHSKIEENLIKSLDFYIKNRGIEKKEIEKYYTYIHYYADTRKLNIIYCMNSEDAVNSTLWAKYYETRKIDENRDFIEVVRKSEHGNTEYLRYWHGSMLILRPLLILFNMEQIYFINKVVLTILTLILIIILLKKSKKLAIIFLIALILTACWYVPMCIEYSVAFYIMILTSIIALKIDNEKNLKEKDKNENLFKLFLLTGIITCFFDFLTTEILTLFVPLIIILQVRKKEDRLEETKEIFKFLIKVCILWSIGYFGMWIAKWTLSSIILKINAFEYVKDNVILRINGLQGVKNHKVLYKGAIGRNVGTIPLIYFINMNIKRWQMKLMLILFVTILLISINWKKIIKEKYFLPMIFMSIMPFLRYLILANHSFRHFFFTFRDLIITIMVLLLLITENINYELLYKDISIKNKISKIFFDKSTKTTKI